MMKNISKIAILIFFLMLQKPSFASLFWDIQTGINFYRQHQYEDAKDYFKTYINNNPNDKDGYYYLALTYLKLKEDKKAKINFKTSYEIASKEENLDKISFEEIDESTLEDYFDMAATYFESGDLKEAMSYADMMLKLNDKSSSAYFIKAKISHMQNDDENAIKFLTQAIIYNSELLNTNLAKSLNITSLPKAPKEIYKLFALEAYYSGDINRAKENIQKYLEVSPDDYEIKTFLTNLYLKNDEIDLAESLIQEIEKNNENNTQNYINEAKIYKTKSEKENYIKALQKGYKVNPNNSQILQMLGNYALENLDYKSAKQYFENLVNVNNELYEAYFGYIYSLIKTGSTKEAMEQIRKISSLGGETSEVSLLLAEICKFQGSFSEALEYMNQAIEKEPNPDYYLKRANLKYILSQYSASLYDLKALEQMNYKPIYEDKVNELYLKNYIKLKDYKNAQKYFDKINSLDKNGILYKYYLYSLYKLQEDEKQMSSQIKQIKKFRPLTCDDFIDMSEVNLEIKGVESALKTIETALKKYPESAQLYYQRAKLNYLMLNKN